MTITDRWMASKTYWGKEKSMDDMTEKEMKTIKMSTLYELRLIFTNGEKTEYTKEEIVELLDKIAMAKEQETK